MVEGVDGDLMGMQRLLFSVKGAHSSPRFFSCGLDCVTGSARGRTCWGFRSGGSDIL